MSGFQQVRLLGMTTLLSAMIWLLADYSLTDTAAVQVRIELPAPGPGRMRLTRVDPTLTIVEAQVSGKKAIISQLRAREPISVRLRISDRAAGRYHLNLLDEIKSQESELSNVFVQAINPETMEVNVDRDITRSMPIQIQSAGTLEYETPPRTEVSEVQVTMSELAYRELEAKDPTALRVLLDPDEYLRTAPRGVLMTDIVPLKSVVGGYQVQLDPDSVILRFKLQERLKEMTLSAVPIKIEASLDLFNNYEVEVRGAGPVLTQPITIKGPPEVIERVESGDIRIHGAIALTAADKADPGTYRYRTPRFILPEDVELVGEPADVELRLVLRKPGADPKP